jgi:hypothetical protein
VRRTVLETPATPARSAVAVPPPTSNPALTHLRRLLQWLRPARPSSRGGGR